MFHGRSIVPQVGLSIRRFESNLDSTRSDRVEEDQTYNRLPIMVSRVGLNSRKPRVSSVETDEGRRWAKENKSWLDLSRGEQSFAGFEGRRVKHY